MKTILVIEDDATLLEAYNLKFTTAGYTVLSATTGEQGVAIANEKIPDLVILDIMLPTGFDGMQVLKMLKNDPRTKHMPIIMMTNIPNQTSESIDAGALWYFVKSDISLDDLVAKIKEILHE